MHYTDVRPNYKELPFADLTNAETCLYLMNGGPAPEETVLLFERICRHVIADHDRIFQDWRTSEDAEVQACMRDLDGYHQVFRDYLAWIGDRRGVS